MPRVLGREGREGRGRGASKNGKQWKQQASAGVSVKAVR